MKTIGKVTNSVTLIGSGVVALSAGVAIYNGVKAKSSLAVGIGALTMLIAVAAFNHSIEKLNEN